MPCGMYLGGIPDYKNFIDVYFDHIKELFPDGYEPKWEYLTVVMNANESETPQFITVKSLIHFIDYYRTNFRDIFTPAYFRFSNIATFAYYFMKLICEVRDANHIIATLEMYKNANSVHSGIKNILYASTYNSGGILFVFNDESTHLEKVQPWLPATFIDNEHLTLYPSEYKYPGFDVYNFSFLQETPKPQTREMDIEQQPKSPDPN